MTEETRSHPRGNYAIEVQFNGHTLNVSGPDPRWVSRQLTRLLTNPTLAVARKQPMGFDGGSASHIERADSDVGYRYYGEGGPQA